MECSERTNVDVALIRCYLLDTRPPSVPTSPVRKKSGLAETTLFSRHLELCMQCRGGYWPIFFDTCLSLALCLRHTEVRTPDV